MSPVCVLSSYLPTSAPRRIVNMCGLIFSGICPVSVFFFVAKGIEVERGRFIRFVRLEDKNEPIFFMIPQRKPSLHANVRAHAGQVDENYVGSPTGFVLSCQVRGLIKGVSTSPSRAFGAGPALSATRRGNCDRCGTSTLLTTLSRRQVRGRISDSCGIFNQADALRASRPARTVAPLPGSRLTMVCLNTMPGLPVISFSSAAVSGGLTCVKPTNFIENSSS